MGRDSGEDCEVEVGKAVGRMLGGDCIDGECKILYHTPTLMHRFGVEKAYKRYKCISK
jgi:hypothetical protein